MKIVEFKISERRTMSREYGEAVLKVDFYARGEDNQLIKLFHTESFISEFGVDVTKGHEKRVRHVLVNCLEKFAASNWKDNLSQPFESNEEAKTDSKVNSENGVPIAADVISINPRNPMYHYSGHSYATLIELESKILSLGDQELDDAYRKYKRSFNTANVFGFIGGGLIGYPLGAALAGAELDGGLILAGVGVLIVGIIIGSKCKKKAVTVIDIFNAKQEQIKT